MPLKQALRYGRFRERKFWRLQIQDSISAPFAVWLHGGRALFASAKLISN
jgi:hypothetical protein